MSMGREEWTLSDSGSGVAGRAEAGSGAPWGGAPPGGRRGAFLPPPPPPRRAVDHLGRPCGRRAPANPRRRGACCREPTRPRVGPRGRSGVPARPARPSVSGSGFRRDRLRRSARLRPPGGAPSAGAARSPGSPLPSARRRAVPRPGRTGVAAPPPSIRRPLGYGLLRPGCAPPIPPPRGPRPAGSRVRPPRPFPTRTDSPVPSTAGAVRARPSVSDPGPRAGGGSVDFGFPRVIHFASLCALHGLRGREGLPGRSGSAYTPPPPTPRRLRRVDTCRKPVENPADGARRRRPGFRSSPSYRR